MAIFFTADSHFSSGDVDTISRDYRPFNSLEEMNEKIIEIWNSQAGEDDIIYHVGDFISYNLKDKNFEKNLNLVKKIKAKVVLIFGNNEDRIAEYEFNNDIDKFKEYLLNLGFYKVYEEDLLLKIGDVQLYLNHHPSKHKEDCENLFGHIHKSALVKKYGFNVGVDNHYFRLFSEDDILELIDRRKYFDIDVYE